MSNLLPSLETFAKASPIRSLSSFTSIGATGNSCNCCDFGYSRCVVLSPNNVLITIVPHRRQFTLVWPKLPHISLCFSTGLQNRSSCFHSRERHSLNTVQSIIEVIKPSDFGLPYQDLALQTPDGITLRCYLLPQTKTLSRTEASTIEDHTTTEDEVAPKLLFIVVL